MIDNIYWFLKTITVRKWVVYDPVDMFVLFIGTHRECLRVMDESYGGLVVIPLEKRYMGDI